MKKYKVNYDRKKPSSEEILSHRDFDGLMKQYNAAPGKVAHQSFWKSAWFIGSMVTAVIVVGIFVIYSNQGNSNPIQKQSSKTIQVATNNPSDTSSIQNNSISANSFVPTKRKISPPIPGLIIRNHPYTVNTRTGATITHISGTKVTFPANAFVDVNGNPVSGNVEVQYREFRDQADFFLSGIPMQYDSAGHTYQFESAGMMEISGMMNGQTVYLKKDKKVKVEFASKNSGTKYNLYQFDTLAGNWNYIGKDNVVLNPEQKMDSASRVALALQSNGKWCGNIPEMQKPIEPYKPVRADKHKHRFTIAIDPKEFPEMKAYKDMIFEVDETNQKFNNNWLQDKMTWESIKLSKGEVENKYKIALTKGKDLVMLDVYPVFDERVFDKVMADYNQKLSDYKKDMEQYNQLLEQRKAKANANGIMNNGNGSIVKVVEGGFMYYTLSMEQDEKKAEAIMRSFTISGFGVYNMDYVAMLPSGRIVDLQVNGNDGKQFAGFATMYHVDRQKNSLFSYHNENPMKGFHFNPKSSNLIWAVKDGKLFYADNDDFAKLPNDGKASITLREVKNDFKSTDEMKRFFKIGQGPQ